MICNPSPSEDLMSPNFPRLALCRLNLFLSGVGRFGSIVFQWGLATAVMQCINAERLNLQATSFGPASSSNHAMYWSDYFFWILIPSTG